MKKPFLRLGPVLLLPVAFAAGWWLSPADPTTDSPAGHVHAGEHAEPGTWTCSMHPQVQQPEPGSCPICGMDLIPLISEGPGGADDGDLPRLRVSEQAAALMRIRTVPAQRKVAEARIRLPGRIAVDERRLHVVSSRFGGRVDRLFIGFTGQHVRAGEPLAELYSPELFAVQEAFLQAVRSSEARSDETTGRLLEGARERLRLLGLTDEQIAEIRATGEPSTHLTLVSPADGFVIERQVSAGHYVETGTQLLTVADLSTVWAELEAFESELGLLQTGQSVEFELPSLPGQRFEGKVAYIDPVVDENKRTAGVRVDLPNEDLQLKPGMLAMGTVIARVGPEGQEPLVIPTSAPLLTGERAIVYVRLADAGQPTFAAREVQLGRRLDGVYTVLGGLSEGEQVVVNGQFKIDSELQIRGRPSMMAPDEHGSTAGTQLLAPAQDSFSEVIDPDFSEQLRPFVEAYLDATEALAADDAETAGAAIAFMENKLTEIAAEPLSGGAQVSWQNYYDSLARILDSMAAVPTLENQRKHLQELTKAIEGIVIGFGGDRLPALNRALCPMVSGGAGTWLQRGEEIRNPYYGSAMLTCGEVTGTLESKSGRP